MSFHSPVSSLRDDLPPLSTPTDLRRVLGDRWTEQRLYMERRNGTGPAWIKTGKRSIFYPRDAVISWLESRLQMPGGQPVIERTKYEEGADRA